MKRFKEARAKLLVEGILARGGGCMEGNHFNEHGIKAIGVVLGYFKNYTKSEYICIDDMGKCSEFALAVIDVMAPKSKYRQTIKTLTQLQWAFSIGCISVIMSSIGTFNKY